MPPVTVDAVILHAFPYGDTSKILRILTPDLGLRSVIAKGARSARSRYGGLLEPFTRGEAQFNLREGRDLFTLTGFSLQRSRQGIGRDLTAFTGASLLSEIAMRAGTEEPDPALFHIMDQALDRLANPGEDPASDALSAIWSLIGSLGFQPEMQHCVRCGRAIGNEESSRFEIEGGGVACLSCRPQGRLLEGDFRREIEAMSQGRWIAVDAANLRLHGDLLDAFLPAHLSRDRGLRSLTLFRELLR